MKIGKILGVLFIIGGIGAICFSQYILSQVHEGKKEVKKTQKAVNLANQALSTNETANQFGRIATNSIQKKINEGKGEISDYEDMAANFNLGGWIVIGIGVIVFGYSFIGKKQ